MIGQTLAAARLSLAGIPSRLGMSAATVLAVALAVAVLLGFLSMAEGFRRTVASSGAEDVAIVTREGTDGEVGSLITADQVDLLSQAPGMARLSPENMVIVSLPERSSGVASNLPLRGLTREGVALRRNLRIGEGRLFTPGSTEIVVGASLLRQFDGLAIGRQVRLGSTSWTVVGIMEAPGTVFESELWADAGTVQNLFRRGRNAQSVRAAVTQPEMLDRLASFVADDTRLAGLKVQTDRDYFAAQSERSGRLIRFLGWPLGLLMAVGALAGALNTLYNSVATRRREITTLRVIGFSGFSAFAGVMSEALVLSLVGAALGIMLCALLFNGMSASTMGTNFTQVVFQFHLGTRLIVNALVMGLVIGLVGGFFPGIRAARQKPRLGFDD